jgi:sec-independent protein translocase protein TatB
MFNVGGGEVLVILLVALIVLGPQRLPDAAKTVGKVMGELRRVSTGFQNEIRSAMDETVAADHDTTLQAKQSLLQKEDQSSATDDAGGALEAASEVSRQASNGQRHRPRRTEPLRAAPDPDTPATAGSDPGGPSGNGEDPDDP